MTELEAPKLPEAFQPFTDSWGFVHTRRVGPDRKPSTMNGVTYTSYAAILLALHGYLQDPRAFAFIMRSSMVEPGLLKRHPTYRPGDQEGVDDYLALACACAILGEPTLPAQILEYGRRTSVRLGPLKLRYWYSNVAPGQLRHRDGRINWSAYMGRFPALLCMLQWATRDLKEKPSAALRSYLAASIVKAALELPKHQDAVFQTWCLIKAHEAVGAPSRAVRLASGLWWAAFRRKGLTMRYLARSYDHRATPFILAWDDFQEPIKPRSAHSLP